MTSRRRSPVPVIVCIAAMALSGPLPADADTIVNEHAEGLRGAPATAASGELAVVVWLHRPAETGPVEIRGRRLGLQGGPRGEELLVSDQGCAIAPDVAMAADGSFVVAWVECRPDQPGRRLVAQRFDRWGQPVAERLDLGRHDTRSLEVALADDGTCVIAFTLQPAEGEQTLWLARVAADGRASELTSVDTEPASPYHSALEVDGLALAGNGTAVLLWHGQRAASSWVAVDAVDPDGFTRRWNLAECAHGEQPASCDDAALGRWGAELLAVWSESQVAAEYSVVAQRLSPSGEPLGAPWTVVDGRGDDRLRGHLDVGRVADGSPFVLWAERRDATSPASAVVGRPIGPDWRPGDLLTVATGPGARAPRVAAASEHGTVVIWLEGEGADADVVSRLLRPFEPAVAAESASPDSP